LISKIFTLVFFSIGSFLIGGSMEVIPSIPVEFGKTFGVDLGNYRKTGDDVISISEIAPDNFAFKVSLDSLYITPSSNAKGYTTLTMYNGTDPFTIMIKVKPTFLIEFKYPAKTDIKKVFVMGNFNDWNRTSLPLEIGDDNSWQLKYYMKPGDYEYKFVRDGVKILDPANPDSLPNGLGGFNNILKIGNNDSNKQAMFIKNEQIVKQDSIYLSFDYYHTDNSDSLNTHQMWILFNNNIVPEEFYNFDGSVLLFSSLIQNYDGLLRIMAVTNSGKIIRENHTLIRNGMPMTVTNYPGDWHFSVLYSLIVDRFYDGDPSNNAPVEDPELHHLANFKGGDIPGVNKKLDEGYFSSLGINALWISPIIQNPSIAFKEYIEPQRKFTGYHGYWPVNPRAVDRHFTTELQLKNFVNIVHTHDMKILLDFVSNHTHEEHQYFKNHQDWYGKIQLDDGTLNLRNWSGETMLTTWFDTFLPSYDFMNNDAAVEQVTSDAVWWLTEYGFDGFRQDATKHVPHKFWKTLTSKMKYFVPDRELYQIGESFGSDELISSFVNPGELNSQFNFSLYFPARWQFSGNPNFLSLNKSVTANLDHFQPVNLMGTITSSHDQVRFMGFADGQLAFDENGTERAFSNPPLNVEHESSYNKLFMFTAWNMSLPGVPVLYYGEEIGQIGANDPDNRRMMRFDNELTPRERTFKRQMSQLIKLRRSYEALSIGDHQVIYEDLNSTVWLKSYFNQRLIILFNNSESAQIVAFHIEGDYSKINSLIDRSFYNLINGTAELKMDAYETKMYLLEKPGQ
jgi:cyclomaltodextrinase / maltogenic alpha-amylase / neopullulanase